MIKVSKTCVQCGHAINFLTYPTQCYYVVFMWLARNSRAIPRHLYRKIKRGRSCISVTANVTFSLSYSDDIEWVSVKYRKCSSEQIRVVLVILLL